MEGLHEARLDGPSVGAHVHRQRHGGPSDTEALEASGLECLAGLGQREEAGVVVLSEGPDEERDRKIVYVARSRASSTAEECPDRIRSGGLRLERRRVLGVGSGIAAAM